jgi:hypothetical protein
LKLPKDVVADHRHDSVLSLLTSATTPLWERGEQAVATLSLTSPFARELQHIVNADLATQGLEQIEKLLAREQKGLKALAEKAPQSERISRLLLVSKDGSERFYRDCDRLLRSHSQRLVACKLDIDGDGFGRALFGFPKLTRALLITDKRAVARALLSMMEC